MYRGGMRGRGAAAHPAVPLHRHTVTQIFPKCAPETW